MTTCGKGAGALVLPALPSPDAPGRSNTRSWEGQETHAFAWKAQCGHKGARIKQALPGGTRRLQAGPALPASERRKKTSLHAGRERACGPHPRRGSPARPPRPGTAPAPPRPGARRLRASAPTGITRAPGAVLPPHARGERPRPAERKRPRSGRWPRCRGAPAPPQPRPLGHTAGGPHPFAAPRTLSPPLVCSGPPRIPQGLPARPRPPASGTRPVGSAPTPFQTIPLLATFASTPPPPPSSQRLTTSSSREVCTPRPFPTLLRTVFSSRGLPVPTPPPKDKPGRASPPRHGDSRRNWTSTADRFSLPPGPRPGTAAPGPPTPSFSERISHPPRSHRRLPPGAKRRENWVSAAPPPGP